jgi:hypothetical protein
MKTVQKVRFSTIDLKDKVDVSIKKALQKNIYMIPYILFITWLFITWIFYSYNLFIWK